VPILEIYTLKKTEPSKMKQVLLLLII